MTDDKKNPQLKKEIGGSSPLSVSYDMAWEEGFKGTEQDFFNLLCTNEDALKEAYNMAIEEGYKGTIEQFQSILGVDAFKKKDETESPFSFEEQESDSKQDLTSSDIPVKPVNYWDEGVKKFNAAALRAKGGIARIPLFMNEVAYSMILPFYPEEEKKFKEMSQKERDDVLSSFPTLPGAFGFGLLAKEGADYFDETKKQAEKIEETLAKFDSSITEDIGDLEFGQAAGRLMSEAIGAVPSMMQAMVPYVGLASIGLASAASKSDELQASGEDFGLQTTANALVSGAAEGLSESITKGIGTRMFKRLAGKTKDQALKTTGGLIKTLGKDMGLEGLSEDLSLAASKLADYGLSGKEDAFDNALLEFVDTFLIGAASSGPLSGIGTGATTVRQASKRRSLNKEANKKDYGSLTDAFRPENVQEIDESQIKIAQTKDSRQYVQFDVDKQVNGGVITKQQGEEVMNNFDEVSRASKEIDGLELTEEQSKKAVNLIKEKRALESVIEGKDENLVKKQKERINEINDELSRVQEDVVTEEQAVEDTVTEEQAPVEEAPVEEAQVTEEAVEEVEEKPRQVRFDINKSTEVEVDDSGKFVGAFNKKTGKEVKTRSSLIKAQNELINQKDYTTGKSAFEGVPVGQEIANESEFVANESQNPKEIAQEYLKEKQSPEAVDPVVEAFVGKYKVSKKSLPDYYKSKDELKDVVAYTITKRGEKASALDGIAQEVSEAVGREVTPQELYDIMTDPRYKSNRIPKQSETLIALRNKFIEVTGLIGTDQQIESVANQDPSKLKPVKEPVEVVQEQAQMQEEAQTQERVEQMEQAVKEEAAKQAEPETKGMVGRVFKAAKDAGSFLKRQAKIHFSAKGLQNDVIYKERQTRDAHLRMYENRVQRTLKNLRAALKNVPKDQRDQVMKEFDLILRGKKEVNESPLPLNLAAIAKVMRAEIDGLSTMIRDSGYIKTEEGIESIQKNIGSYLNRSYRIFSDGNWASKVSEEVKENARAFFRRQAAKEGRVESAEEIEIRVNEILAKAEDNKYIVRGKDGGIDNDILKRRKDIPAEIRALMGEVKDPAVNYQNTIAKQAMLLLNYEFQKKIADAGMATFFTTTPTKENTVQIAKEGNEAFRELAGLYTTPEIAKTFEISSSPTDGWYNTIVKFNGAIKWLKTVGSIATHFKNILGNHGFVLINGHVDVKEFKKAGQLVWSEFKGQATKDQQKHLDRLISLGVVKQSTTLGDISTAFGDKSFEEAYQRSIIDPARNVYKKKGKIVEAYKAAKESFRKTRLGEGTKSLVETLNDLYQSEDDFFKIVAFSIEEKRYAEALYGKKPSELTQAESKIVDEKVSEIVKNTYPTYDRVGPLIKKIGRAPFIGAFVSFQAESIRTAFKTFIIAKDEIFSGNKKLQIIGAKRFAGAALYTGFKSGIALQLGLAAKSMITGGEDDESQEYNDLKEFIAPWSKNSVIAITSKSPGKYTYIDLSANDPHAFLSKMIVAAKSESDAFDMSIKALQSVLEPFVGKDLLFAWATDSYLLAARNDLSQSEKIDQIITKSLELIEPGSVTSFRRFIQAAEESEKRALSEIGGFTGFRPVEVDINRSFLFRTIDLENEKSAIRKEYNRVRYSDKSTDQEAREAYEKADAEFKNLFERAHKLSMSAIRLGVDQRDVYNTLIKNGFTKEEVAHIMSGREYTYKPKRIK